MPASGFLIVASITGYNDSKTHGSPTKSWPIITVHKGQNVTIIVCNTDVQPHGFQITHYFANGQETLVPGQVLRVSFIADQTGSYLIYCDIFCTVHTFMQDGLLNVAP
jgi:heme/copper-type cytochrome/quinol oxidase subunit 2